VRLCRQRDADPVAGTDLAALQHDRHDPGLADELALSVAAEHGGEQARPERLDLVSVAQAGDLDEGGGGCRSFINENSCSWVPGSSLREAPE
jgi:hypothetical protein